MEAISKIESHVEIKQHNSISVDQSNLKICKNRLEMPFDNLLASVSKKLMSYAMVLTNNNEADAWDLLQSTMEKLIKNREKLQESNQPVAYAKTILKNVFIDSYRKNKRMISIEEIMQKQFRGPGSIFESLSKKLSNAGYQEGAVEYQEMLKCLDRFDETDQTILLMLGKGHSYREIQEVIGDITMANLRVKASRARIELARLISKKI